MSGIADRRDVMRPTQPPHSGRRLGDAPTAAEQGWWPGLMLAMLTAAVVTITLASQQLTISRAGYGAPDEGFYWAVAQYQIAHQRLKQELRAIAAGEPARPEELARRVAVLASKTSILSEPSEVQGLLKAVPGYTEATQSLAELQKRIGPTLDKSDFAQADAARVLDEFKAIDDEELLSRLANDVRQSEIGAKEDVLRSLARRIQWVWGGFALCWTALVLWLVYAVRSRRRYRVAAADRQRAVDAMEQALSAKRKFLSMVSHEVRSPLQNIVASAELLALQSDRPESIAAIRRIRHAVTGLQGQLRDLLTIARSESSQLGTQVETFEMGELVHDVCAGQEEAAQAKGLEFNVKVLDTPLTVNADPIRIAQVLRNLVENAVRYTSAGRIDICLDPYEASGRSTLDGFIRFRVKDTGPGLPDEALRRLQGFDVPFHESGDGTGIGLFVIRDVLQQLGGQIDVQRKEGQGTTFTVAIPAALAPEMAADPVLESPLSILIVDDRQDVLSSLSDITLGLGHTCQTVSTAEEARRLVNTARYDVVLVDLDMPDESGLALATDIRRPDGLNSTSMLILISAPENRDVGKRWPFDGFLEKPIDGLAISRLIGSRTKH